MTPDNIRCSPNVDEFKSFIKFDGGAPSTLTADTAQDWYRERCVCTSTSPPTCTMCFDHCPWGFARSLHSLHSLSFSLLSFSRRYKANGVQSRNFAAPVGFS